MHKRYFIFLFTLLSTLSLIAELPRKAMCTAPVLDIVEYPLGGQSSSLEQVKQAYKNIPISWGPQEQDREVCPRKHQLLLHEIVTILDETMHEAYIQLDTCYTLDTQNNKQSVTGWILKDHLKDLDLLDRKKTPAPISWQLSNVDRANIKTVTLFTSYSDQTGTIYSAGTRFILNKLININFEVYAYSELNNEYYLIEIPQSSCVFETFNLNNEEKRNYLCRLLGVWTMIPNHCIPLVWGGASIGTVCLNDNFSLQSYINENGDTRNAWVRPSKTVSDVYTGVDASGVILRVAQIVGIPYFCRNSLTAAQSLSQLSPQQYPHEGDLIWVPGALMVINNFAKNTIITAMSYTAGYGALVELPLNKVFKDINTYQQLTQAYRAGKPLTLLNRDGSSARTVEEFKILKLSFN